MAALLQLMPLIMQALSGALILAPQVIAQIQSATDAIQRAHDEGRDLNDADWELVHSTRQSLEAALLVAARDR